MTRQPGLLARPVAALRTALFAAAALVLPALPAAAQTADRARSA